LVLWADSPNAWRTQALGSDH